MFLVDDFRRLPSVARVRDALRPGVVRAAGGLWGGSAALLLASLVRERGGPWWVLTADDEEAVRLGEELSLFDTPSEVLPALELDVEGRPEAASFGSRIRVLQALRGRHDWLLLSGIGAALDPVPRPRALGGNDLRLRCGDALAQAALLERILAAGLRRVPVVLGPGEVSQRGDVLDVFPIGAAQAVRLEVFDDQLESIRIFDPATQRSAEQCDELLLALGAAPAEALRGHVVEHVARPDLVLAQYEPLRIDEQRARLTLHTDHASEALSALQDSTRGLAQLNVSSLPSHDLDFKVLSAGSATGSGETDPVGRLRSIRGLRGAVVIVARTANERDRLNEIFAHKGVSLRDERVRLEVGALHRGFRLPDLEVTVVSNVEFAGLPAPVRVREPMVLPTKALASFFELGPGDLVVHAVHGIAVFEGTELVERGDSAEDHLRLRFRDEVLLLVPASKIHLVQKYVGTGGAAPKLDKLGGKGFARRKAEVQQSLYDLAADLLDVQAKRAQITREPYPRDPLEEEFLDGFPFTDTLDQQQAWQEIRAELEGRAALDRLLCGDVGFGKTELAMRAAFKVAITGRQVAVLVPTTVLADQHAKTFGDRFAAHGLQVEALSRFRSPKERRRILDGAARGSVDVLIGTHRLLSKDVQLKNLGLLIIDEEQRFGVRHKEHFKRLRLSVDVLSLSATPIPRTLQSSLLGLRNISTLSTPPPGRQEVDTKIHYYDAQKIREALERELARDGQAFVLSNRVRGLDAVARDIQKLVPRARIAVGHGQMTETEMERTIRRFIAGDVDILVSTTIIENGLDIPRANTMLIERADRFGLAELHQLRGRVGRSDRQAYCRLLLDRDHPPRPEAMRRLKALEEFSHLGAGFVIAMKDLEIRGAGNLLGREQSGHIAAIGYEMYTQLLHTAAEAIKSTQPARHVVQEVDVDLRLQAFLPDTFVTDAKARLETLREMDGATSVDAALELRRSLADRHGTLPQPAINLLAVFLLKHSLLAHGVLGVQFVADDRIVVRHPPGHPLGGAWLDAFADVRQVEAGKTHLILPAPRPRSRPWTGDQVCTFLLDALLGAEDARRMHAWRQRGERGERSERTRAGRRS